MACSDKGAQQIPGTDGQELAGRVVRAVGFPTNQRPS